MENPPVTSKSTTRMWTLSRATSQSRTDHVESGCNDDGEFMSFKATGASHEATLHCPNCNHEIRLTESLAAPLLAETRQRFQQQLASKDAEMERKTEALRLEREQVAKDREQIENHVAKRLTAKRAQLVATESKKARETAAAELQAKGRGSRGAASEPAYQQRKACRGAKAAGRTDATAARTRRGKAQTRPDNREARAGFNQ
ncbi:hypothetical protein [Bradyrhizobium macuxiense]|uniref:hypothetical protein n=1 Tax=Bradyrhizobium macuxiense TaxID=1755647 RepID=UPI001FDA9E51|nr:hypothetical protein [Bradyrhizobium macuxiense]